MPVTLPDLLAIAYFFAAWIVYSVVIEKTAAGRGSLNARVNSYRDNWMTELIGREVRMVDAQVTAALQNGTAFFASTTLLAIGGGLTLLRATDEAMSVLGTLPLGIRTSPALWELKCIGLIVIFVYAFFKFAWSYRLYNYVAIMLGATPFASEKDTPEAETHVLRTARLFTTAGRHFNRGQRAFFFALGYLGWFISPCLLMISSVVVAVLLWRRQFSSDSRRAVCSE